MLRWTVCTRVCVASQRKLSLQVKIITFENLNGTVYACIYKELECVRVNAIHLCMCVCVCVRISIRLGSKEFNYYLELYCLCSRTS